MGRTVKKTLESIPEPKSRTAKSERTDKDSKSKKTVTPAPKAARQNPAPQPQSQSRYGQAVESPPKSDPFLARSKPGISISSTKAETAAQDTAISKMAEKASRNTDGEEANPAKSPPPAENKNTAPPDPAVAASGTAPSASPAPPNHKTPGAGSPGTTAEIAKSGSSDLAQKEGAAPRCVVSTIVPSEIDGFANFSPAIQRLIHECLALTKQNLAYVYGSADPNNGGLDCSGFVYRVVRSLGVKAVPRQSNEQYAWVRREGQFFSVLSRDPETFELEDLEPGDLMFWTNTYEVKRSIPITHVMIYLGLRRSDGQRIMVGASEGRSYRGQPHYGVSVFEFRMPSRENQTEGKGAFVGYGRIPGLSTVAVSGTTTAPGQ
jgi:cell wall-associated NlpC family hydrolase